MAELQEMINIVSNAGLLIVIAGIFFYDIWKDRKKKDPVEQLLCKIQADISDRTDIMELNKKQDTLIKSTNQALEHSNQVTKEVISAVNALNSTIRSQGEAMQNQTSLIREQTLFIQGLEQRNMESKERMEALSELINKTFTRVERIGDDVKDIKFHSNQPRK